MLTDAEVIEKARTLDGDNEITGPYICISEDLWQRLLDMLGWHSMNPCRECHRSDGNHEDHCFIGLALAALRREVEGE